MAFAFVVVYFTSLHSHLKTQQTWLAVKVMVLQQQHADRNFYVCSAL